jgi:hypothetical protein
MSGKNNSKKGYLETALTRYQQDSILKEVNRMKNKGSDIELEVMNDTDKRKKEEENLSDSKRIWRSAWIGSCVALCVSIAQIIITLADLVPPIIVRPIYDNDIYYLLIAKIPMVAGWLFYVGIFMIVLRKLFRRRADHVRSAYVVVAIYLGFEFLDIIGNMITWIWRLILMNECESLEDFHTCQLAVQERTANFYFIGDAVICLPLAIIGTVSAIWMLYQISNTKVFLIDFCFL